HADGQHVELAALGGDVGGQALAQYVFLEHDPVQIDLGVLFLEDLRKALHADHVRSVDGGDGEGIGGADGARQGNTGSTEQQFADVHFGLLFRSRGGGGFIVFVLARVLRYERLVAITTLRLRRYKAPGAHVSILFRTSRNRLDARSPAP